MMRVWGSVLFFAATPSFAADINLLSTAEQSLGIPLPGLLVLSAFTLLPSLLLMMSSFTRIIIVLTLLRQSLGANGVPPNQVLTGLSLFLTFFVMGPTLDQIYQQAYKPLADKRITLPEAWDKAQPPLKEFMLRHTRSKEVAVLSQAAHVPLPNEPSSISMRVLIPSFLLSELKTAFQIGIMVMIPMVIIDLLVASVLAALGMVMMPPTLVSLPIKLMLFVLVDGWNLLVGSLVQSFMLP